MIPERKKRSVRKRKIRAAREFRSTKHPLVQENCEKYNGENDGEDNEQTAALVPGGLLVPGSLGQLNHGAAGIISGDLYVVCDGVELLPLLAHDLRYLAEEHVEVANALLDVADLFLSFDNERLLEVDLVLRGKTRELLLLLLLLQMAGVALVGARLGLVGSSCRTDGCPLLLERDALEILELFEGVLELGRDLVAFVFLLFL